MQCPGSNAFTTIVWNWHTLYFLPGSLGITKLPWFQSEPWSPLSVHTEQHSILSGCRCLSFPWLIPSYGTRIWSNEDSAWLEWIGSVTLQHPLVPADYWIQLSYNILENTTGAEVELWCCLLQIFKYGQNHCFLYRIHNLNQRLCVFICTCEWGLSITVCTGHTGRWTVPDHDPLRDKNTIRCDSNWDSLDDCRRMERYCYLRRHKTYPDLHNSKC